MRVDGHDVVTVATCEAASIFASAQVHIADESSSFFVAAKASHARLLSCCACCQSPPTIKIDVDEVS
jgi:hypothetical protein